MTNNRERAEKLVTDMDCDSCQYSLEIRKNMTALIEQALDEAVRDAHKHGLTRAYCVKCDTEYKEGLRRGTLVGLEMAIKAIDDVPGDTRLDELTPKQFAIKTIRAEAEKIKSQGESK